MAVFGSLNINKPPNASRAAINNIGTAQCVAIRAPNITDAKIAGALVNTADCTPRAVPLKTVNKY